MKTGRNEPCPCGSGKKYKQCCMNKTEGSEFSIQQKILILIFAGLMLFGLYSVVIGFGKLEHSSANGPGEGRVWSEEHQHWH